MPPYCADTRPAGPGGYGDPREYRAEVPVSGAATGVFVFGIHVLVGGSGLTFVPNVAMGKREARRLFVFTVAARV